MDTGSPVYALTFTPNGEYLVSGGYEGVHVWRVEDSKRVAMIQVDYVKSVAVSKNNKFIAAGSYWGDVLVWDATNYQQVFASKIPSGPAIIYDVDFSPDSSRLVSADRHVKTATIWDIVARQKVRTLDHDQFVYAAKYSPQGDRIATATEEYIRVWDSADGRLIIDIKAQLHPLHGLLWFNQHLFVKTQDSKIKEIDASTGSTVSELPVPGGYYSRIALLQHGQFIAYSTEDNVTFWDTSTHLQLGLISRTNETRAIAFSLDTQLAMVVERDTIIVNYLPFIWEPDIRIVPRPLHAWKNGQLTKAEALLTAMPWSKNTDYHVLASRALVRARLRHWDAALVDAERSIKIQPSTIGYIAKFVALVGSGGVHAGCRAWDDASLHFRSDHFPILLLIKAVVLFMARDHENAISRIDHLIAVTPSDPVFYVVQAFMHLVCGDLHMENGDSNRAIQSFETARVKLGSRKEQPSLIVSLISGWEFDDIGVIIQQKLCDAFFLTGRIAEAAESILRMVNQETNMTQSVKTWVSEFIQRCLLTPASNRDTGLKTGTRNDAPHPMTPLLREWVKSKLTSGSWKDALSSAANFTLPKFTVYQVICEHLEITDRLADAVICLHQMCHELAQEIVGERENWKREFESRCSVKLASLGDIAMDTKEYHEAILQYTTALSLHPDNPQDLLGRRSKAYAGKGEWRDALNDANQVIKLNPSSLLGYERKHAALRGLGHHEDATGVFEVMLSTMSESSDPEIHERYHHYKRMEETISTAIKDTIHDSPPVLINTISGRLCDKTEQMVAFKKTPTSTELILAMGTHIDLPHIEQEVGKYFRYATFSHKWEDNEPLFEKVIRVVVFDLEASPAHEKLRMFCKIVREAGFNWAWSDTCCINKGDHFVLQEALVSMFQWYERSAMTIIFLRGVGRFAQLGALTRSIWNMRAWTLQEYHASKVVRIYTEDWTPYLDLKVYNHKESPEIISEMEEATGISAQALTALRPGMDDIREKLRLASTRETTRIEDAAYSLLGIFTLSLPITYGEGDKALGRLLSLLLSSSGDMSILAWTGKSGHFNSCLPSSITVFSEPPTSHIPLLISDSEMEAIITGIRSLDMTLLTTLYDRINELPVPSFSGLRMKLPCLAFKLGQLSVSHSGSKFVSRSQTNVLGVVEITSDENLFQLGPLYLVHPWIDYLLDRQPPESAPDTMTKEITEDQLSELPSFPRPSNIPSTIGKTRTGGLLGRLGRTFGGRTTTHVQDTAPLSPPSAAFAGGQSVPDTASLLPPSTMSPSKKQMRILQFMARLRQPFGALLLAGTRRNMDEYKRVAAETLIRVQVKEITPEVLDRLLSSVKMLDVL